MILICETCHKHWKPARDQARHNTCPKCRHRKRSRASRAREVARRIVREGRLEGLPEGRCPTPDELLRLMADADAAGAKALDAARAIATRFKPDGAREPPTWEI